MTAAQMVLITCSYLAVFVGAAYFTRAKVRRIEGALADGSVFGFAAPLAIALGEGRG